MRTKNLEKEKAIRTIAMQIIAEEGLENLSMQKLAKAANISPRTIYIKYKDKEDLLIKLFIEAVLGPYEEAVLKGFNPEMDFAEGVKRIWLNTFCYLKNNPHAFALIKHGKSSPMLQKAYRENNISEGDFFLPVQIFLKSNKKKGIIPNYPHEVHRAILFAPIAELVNEYFDNVSRPKQIITEKILMLCCDVVIKGILNKIS
ncbi:MAG: TetR/AcrR family transcriptional regulator [Flavitalea sp.]